ncbi:unnamed protein product, partial [marine sediment metagenome]
GSEVPFAIIMLDNSRSGMMVQCREHLYTGLSRGKLMTFMIGNMETASAICKETAIDKRKTFLSQLLTLGPPA